MLGPNDVMHSMPFSYSKVWGRETVLCSALDQQQMLHQILQGCSPWKATHLGRLSPLSVNNVNLTYAKEGRMVLYPAGRAGRILIDIANIQTGITELC